MLKYIVGIVIAVVIAVGAYYAWNFGKGIGQSNGENQEQVETPAAIATTTYSGTTFSLVHPVNFTVDPLYKYQGVPNKPIDGVKFTVPMTMATGTTLASDSYLSVEWLPRAQTCTGDIYILENVKAAERLENGVEYSVASTSEGAAGSLYEEEVYALTDSSPCIAVRYVIHSVNEGNFATGTVRQFDRTALLRAFDEIRHSITLIPQATP